VVKYVFNQSATASASRSQVSDIISTMTFDVTESLLMSFLQSPFLIAQLISTSSDKCVCAVNRDTSTSSDTRSSNVLPSNTRCGTGRPTTPRNMHLTGKRRDIILRRTRLSQTSSLCAAFGNFSKNFLRFVV